MTTYLIIMIFANIVSIIACFKHINITVLSIVPLALILLTVFQAIYFSKQQDKKGFDTAYGNNFTHEEQKYLLKYASKSLLFSIPLHIPFVFFFFAAVKLISILIYILSLVSGIIFYRVKHKDALHYRISSENQDLEEQRKKEELGKWK